MKTLATISLSVILGAFAGHAQGQAIDFKRYRVIDLTYPFNERTLYWPTAPSGFKLERLAFGLTPGGYFYSSNKFSAPEHGGTHLDAPVHFFRGGRTTDQIPVEQLIAPAVVIDVSAQTARNPNYRLTRADVQEWEKKNGPVPSGAIVFLRTGWGTRWPNAKAYLGDDTPGDASKLHFPSYGADATRYLIGRKVGALGADVASIDYGASKDFIVHQLVAAANVAGLENIANLNQLPPTGATIIALPMKIENGSGGPLRVIALVPRR
jgi:kynurenine formamidase